MLSVFFFFFPFLLSLVKSCHQLWTQVPCSQKFVDTNPLSPNVKIYFFYAHAMLTKNFCSPGLRKRLEQSAADLN